jgi:hypothetical protein
MFGRRVAERAILRHSPDQVPMKTVPEDMDIDIYNINVIFGK